MTAILGISAFYHDSAVTLIIDGEIIAAAQEERFSRKKHDASYPSCAIDYCLLKSGLKFRQLDYVVFYDKPFLKFERLLETYVAFAPKGLRSFLKAIPVWLREKLFLKNMLIKQIKKSDKTFDTSKLMFSEHHFSHAASAFYASPFEKAVVLTLDGVGEWATTTVAIGNSNKLRIIKEIHFPHSLGLLYSAFTYYLGFRVNSGEYKVMGLAPYGNPKYKDLILKHLIDVKEDGSFRLQQDYFNYATGLNMTNKKFARLFGKPVRKLDNDELTQFHMDIAASIQAVIEEVVLAITKTLASEYNIDNLCLAGGVALNCVVNGKILKQQAFKNIWVQPASGDAGGSLGAALGLWHQQLNKPRVVSSGDLMQGAYLGPSYSQLHIEKTLLTCEAKFITTDEATVLEQTAQALAEGKVVGWFQGRMEFGPRALGNRSILADPRNEKMQKTLNLKIKYRESFRPFAPSVLIEDASSWFGLDYVSPYMLLVDYVKLDKRLDITRADIHLQGINKLSIKRSLVPAITHVDYSARIQTVNKKTNPKYHALISKFKEKTGCPILVNTSFNVRGEPIVCTIEDAFRCFMGTKLDLLVIGNCILKKELQNSALIDSYQQKYAKD